MQEAEVEARFPIRTVVAQVSVHDRRLVEVLVHRLIELCQLLALNRLRSRLDSRLSGELVMTNEDYCKF